MIRTPPQKRRGRRASRRLRRGVRRTRGLHSFLVLASLSLFVSAHFCLAQPPTPGKLEFEVAVVKAGDPYGHESGLRLRSLSQIELPNVTLRSLVKMAYGVEDSTLVGGPKWAASELFSVVAKMPVGVPRTLANLRQMLTALLVQRFNLEFHSETRELPAFLLVVAKGGPSMHASAPEEVPQVGGGPGRILGTAQPIGALVHELSKIVERPILDRTGLTGTYDFVLEFASIQASASESTAPLLFAAIREQLGLRLEASRAPIHVMVIDRAERPD